MASTWLTGRGATISAWWILVANAWMQHPVGMYFNPETARNEMDNFFEVAFSPIAVMKFCHSVLSGWVLASVFVIGICCWYLLKKREQDFAISSIKIASIVGLTASILVALSGDHAGYQVAQTQPMKLAAMEGYYEGEEGPGLVAFGILNPEKKAYNDNVDPFLFKIEIPHLLSMLAERRFDAYVPGINNIINGNYTLSDGTQAISVPQRMEIGQTAISAFDAFRKAKTINDINGMDSARTVLDANVKYFGYGYVTDPAQVIPNVPLVFYTFRAMVYLGGYFIFFFIVMMILAYRKKLANIRWIQYVALWSIPFAYVCGMCGWVVAECGRQPWAIHELLPTWAAISKLHTSSVVVTFFIFLALFTIMLIAGIRITVKVIKKGPAAIDQNSSY